MANYCDNDIYFYVDNPENADSIRQLYNDLEKQLSIDKSLYAIATMNGKEPPEGVSCRGVCYYVSFDEKKNAVFINCETAWGPSEGLYDFIAKQYKGVKYVFLAIESGCEIYVNTDTGRKRRFFPAKYIFDNEEAGMEFYNDAKTLLKHVNEYFQPKSKLKTVKKAVEYAYKWNLSHDKYAAVHVFES